MDSSTKQPGCRSTGSRDIPGLAVMFDLLTKTDALREHQKLLAWKLEHMLTTGYAGSGYEQHRQLCRSQLTELRRVWREFAERGGVTAADLTRFLEDNRELRSGYREQRPTARLRCIVNNDRKVR